MPPLKLIVAGAVLGAPKLNAGAVLGAPKLNAGEALGAPNEKAGAVAAGALGFGASQEAH